MENSIKNGRMIQLMSLMGIVFVGNIYSMRMSQSQLEARKKAASEVVARMKKEQGIQLQQKQQPQMSEQQRQQELEKAFEFGRQSEQQYKQGDSNIEQAINQKVAALQPGEFFVYAQGTADGIVVTWDVLQKSNMLKNMIEDSDAARTGQFAIPLLFSIDKAKAIFEIIENNVDLNSLSLDKLGQLITTADYLDMVSILQELKKEFDNKLKNVSLEQLVDAFNDNSDLRKEIFYQIFEIIKSICWTAICQASSDAQNKRANFTKVHLWKGGETIDFQSFDDYEGKMMPIRRGSKVLYIPDYKILGKLNPEAEQLFKSKVKLPNVIASLACEWVNVCKVNIIFYENSLVNFLDMIVEGVQIKYDNFSWRKRWLYVPW